MEGRWTIYPDGEYGFPVTVAPVAELDVLREIIARASRMAESERAEMTQQILQEAL